MFTAISNICIFAKVEFIPIGSSQALTYTISGILYTFLGKLALKEDINFKKGIGVVLCLSGSTLIVFGLANNVELSHPLYRHGQNGTQIFNNNGSEVYSMDSNHEERKILTTTIGSLILGVGLCALHAITEAGYMFCSESL